MTRTIISAATALCLAFGALPVLAQSVPSDLVGTWDISEEACAATGTSFTRIVIAPDRIDTYGGNAVLREVDRSGDVTFAAGDFEQLEGAAEVQPRTRAYFRLDQRDGSDRMRFVWKDVQAVDLVRCETAGLAANDAASASSEASSETEPGYDGRLPIPLGLWVVAGGSCKSPANAGWRVHDGAGLRGASSVRCEIVATERQGDGIVVSQLCEASDDGEIRPARITIIMTAPRPFTLVEANEEARRDFNWCGSRLRP